MMSGPAAESYLGLVFSPAQIPPADDHAHTVEQRRKQRDGLALTGAVQATFGNSKSKA
jgi:hypothetical protein